MKKESTMESSTPEKQNKPFYNSTIYARDLPDAWFLSLVEVLQKGRKYLVTNGSYQGQYRYQLDYYTVFIKYPGTRPLLPQISESVGIPDPVSIEYLDEYLPYLMCGDKKCDEQYTYGQYLESQIDKVIKKYKGGGYGTNQAIMTIGDPSTLDLADPPCLRMIDTNIIDGALNFYVYFRSWDLWGGFPANLSGIQLLKEYMAGELDVAAGVTVAASKGLHLYDFVIEYAEKYTGVTFTG